jgi:hypothetical protein
MFGAAFPINHEMGGDVATEHGRKKYSGQETQHRSKPWPRHEIPTPQNNEKPDILKPLDAPNRANVFQEVRS